MSIRIAAFVDHEIGYQLLQQLLQFAKVAPVEIAAVVTTAENDAAWWPGVAPLAKEAGVPLYVYSPPCADILALQEIDYCLLLSWKHVLPEVMLGLAKRATVNLHYSLLPELRGVYPVNWALMEGKKETGVSYHVVIAAIDAGVVLLQQTVPVLPQDTARSLQLRLDGVAQALFPALLQQLVQHQLVPHASNVGHGGSYRSREAFLAAREIGLEKTYTGQELLDLLRGMTFLEESRNAFFVDPASGKKIYVRVALTAEDEA